MRENHLGRRGPGLLSVIAGHAGRNDVAGSMISALRDRDDVVLRQTVGDDSTVSTPTAVSGLHGDPLRSGKVTDRRSPFECSPAVVGVSNPVPVALAVSDLIRLVVCPVSQVPGAVKFSHPGGVLGPVSCEVSRPLHAIFNRRFTMPGVHDNPIVFIPRGIQFALALLAVVVQTIFGLLSGVKRCFGLVDFTARTPFRHPSILAWKWQNA
jgi:hypothetical protein